MEISSPSTQKSGPVRDYPELLALSKKLEASFVSEMLGFAGLNSGGASFSGGAGETQFASFLREAQAQAIVERNGIGLGKALFDSLVKRQEQP